MSAGPREVDAPRGPVLVTGATGNTGRKVARALDGAGVPVRRASRRPGADGVRFDWADPSTHAEALAEVERMYLVAPVGVHDPVPLVRPFLERGLAGTLRRVVLLSSSALGMDQGGLGALHRLVSELVPEWAVLRPSWFMQNFVDDHPVADGLRAGRVTSATGTGRVGFVDTSDIADVAATLLLQADPPHEDHVLTGPEALSYDEVCALAEEVGRRRIEHVDVPTATQAALIAGAGVPEDFATMLAGLDEAIRYGAEDRVTGTVEQLTGHPPRSLRALFESRRDQLRAGTAGDDRGPLGSASTPAPTGTSG